MITDLLPRTLIRAAYLAFWLGGSGVLIFFIAVTSKHPSMIALTTILLILYGLLLFFGVFGGLTLLSSDIGYVSAAQRERIAQRKKRREQRRSRWREYRRRKEEGTLTALPTPGTRQWESYIEALEGEVLDR